MKLGVICVVGTLVVLSACSERVEVASTTAPTSTAASSTTAAALNTVPGGSTTTSTSPSTTSSTTSSTTTNPPTQTSLATESSAAPPTSSQAVSAEITDGINTAQLDAYRAMGDCWDTRPEPCDEEQLRGAFAGAALEPWLQRNPNSYSNTGEVLWGERRREVAPDGKSATLYICETNQLYVTTPEGDRFTEPTYYSQIWTITKLDQGWRLTDIALAADPSATDCDADFALDQN